MRRPPSPSPPPRRPRRLPDLPLLLLVAATALLAPSARAVWPVVTDTTDCHRVPAQTALNYDKMRGTWYVVEVVTHLPPAAGTGTGRAGFAVATVEACPMVEVWPPVVPAPEQRLRLQWRERRSHLNYDLRLPEPDKHKGYWLADQPQNGSLVVNEKYRQFEGAVLVMKVTATHAVLTFCGNPGAERQVYSVVMAREPTLPTVDLTAVNEMLVHRGLPHVAIKRTCKDFRGNAARVPAAATSLLGAAVTLAVLALARL